MLATKNTHKLSHKILCLNHFIQNRRHQVFHSALPIFHLRQKPSQTLASRYNQVLHRCNRVSVTNIRMTKFIKLEFPSFMDRSRRVWKLPSDTHIGTTEIHISVSPRFLKFPHFEQIGTIEFYFGFTELVNNGVTVRFLEMPIYTPPPHPTCKRSTQNSSPLPISKFMR